MSDAAPIDDASLHCPLCGYALLGLTSRRCPECGHAFDLDELRLAARRNLRHDAFEHSHRPIIAFFEATMQSLGPLTFWRRLTPAVAIVPRRLWIWASIWLVVAIAWMVFALVPTLVEQRSFSDLGFALRLILRQREPIGSALRLMLAAVAWPAVTFLAASTFAITLRRAGVRQWHLGRVALYGWPAIVLPTIVLGTIMLALRWEGYSQIRFGTFAYWLDQLDLSPAAGLCLIGLMVVSTFHVVVAHVRYLRVPAAVGQSLLVAIVTWLAIASALLASR